MPGHNKIIAAAAVVAACAAPTAAAENAHSVSPAGGPGTNIRMLDYWGTATRPGPSGVNRATDLRMPDQREPNRTPPPVRTPSPTLEIRELPSSGFDWGDAGIGAAGMLALLAMGAGSTLLVSGWRRAAKLGR